MHDAPEQFTKKELAMMLWKAGQIIGQLMAASEMEDEPDEGLGGMEPEGNA